MSSRKRRGTGNFIVQIHHVVVAHCHRQKLHAVIHTAISRRRAVLPQQLVEIVADIDTRVHGLVRRRDDGLIGLTWFRYVNGGRLWLSAVMFWRNGHGRDRYYIWFNRRGCIAQ